jgi:hypothetical protein
MNRLSLLLLVVVTAYAAAAPAPFPRPRSREPDRYWRIDFSQLTEEHLPLRGIFIAIQTAQNALSITVNLSDLRTLDEVVTTLKRKLADGCSISTDGFSLKIRAYKGQPIESIKVMWLESTRCSLPRVFKPQQELPARQAPRRPAQLL